MQKQVRVLYFVDRMLQGGIQTFVLEVVQHIDRSKIQIDVLLLDDGADYPLEETLKSYGCKVYKLKGIWIRKATDYIAYNKAMKHFFAMHNDYDVVHMHSASKNFLVLKYAKKYKIEKRIAHSHSTNFQTKSKRNLFAGNALKPILRYYATDYYACSKIAGEWLFGRRIVENDKFKVVCNAIDYNRFKEDAVVRNKMRKALEIQSDELVVGTVGRFEEEKNHSFLLGVFAEILKQKPCAKLLLVGDGTKRTDLEVLAYTMGIAQSVIFAGYHKNANDYMQAMDVFVLPSKFEGLGIVLIEAQANGMPCFASADVVPKEAKVTEQLQFISLDETAGGWATKILDVNKTKKYTYQQIKENGYVINDMVKQLEKCYQCKQ